MPVKASARLQSPMLSSASRSVSLGPHGGIWVCFITGADLNGGYPPSRGTTCRRQVLGGLYSNSVASGLFTTELCRLPYSTTFSWRRKLYRTLVHNSPPRFVKIGQSESTTRKVYHRPTLCTARWANDGVGRPVACNRVSSVVSSGAHMPRRSRIYRTYGDSLGLGPF